MFDKLKVLDGLDQDGEECLSEVEDEGDFEGEGDDNDFIDPSELNEKDKEKLRKQGYSFEEDEGEDAGEGEGEYDDEGEEQNEADAKAGKKRAREDKPLENGKENKRQKVE